MCEASFPRMHRPRIGAAVAVAFILGATAFATGRAAVDAPPATAEQKEKTVVIPVEGMSCVACTASVRKTLSSIAGVTEVKVNLVERNARVRFDSKRVSPDRLVDAINRLGYRAGVPAEVR
jgi:copper chaperone CopZ